MQVFQILNLMEADQMKFVWKVSIEFIPTIYLVILSINKLLILYISAAFYLKLTLHGNKAYKIIIFECKEDPVPECNYEVKITFYLIL